MKPTNGGSCCPTARRSRATRTPRRNAPRATTSSARWDRTNSACCIGASSPLARTRLHPAVRSFVLHEKRELLIGFGVRDQFVAGLLAERLEVLHPARIGGECFQHLPAAHVAQRFLRAQDRQRAVQAAGVQFLVELHGVPLLILDTAIFPREPPAE